MERSSRYPDAHPTRTGAAMNRKMANTRVTQVSDIVLLVVLSLEMICPKKNRFSPL